MTASPHQLLVRQLGLRDYQDTWEQMQRFTNERSADTTDELWLLEHPPVFTLGQAGKHEHLLNPGDIPIVQADRGGQVTYHGPGQLIGYLLLDLRRAGLGIRQLVTLLEQSIITLLEDYSIPSEARRDAPGVYVHGRKIAALGLRVRRGCSFHGLALNVDMDMEPFSRINPCGYEGLQVAQIRDLGGPIALDHIGIDLAKHIGRQLNYSVVITK
jgi:lipoyl(octanoyl) transferase